jgi:hypothetical protein
MARPNTFRVTLCLGGVACVVFARSELRAEDSTETRQQLQQLQEQNQALQQQLLKQGALIESLSRQVNTLQQASEAKGSAAEPASAPQNLATEAVDFSSAKLGKVKISGEGGAVFWDTGSEGMFPNSEFRLDEARLFVEAPAAENVYAYFELNLATREAPDVTLRLGEAYLEFEDLWPGLGGGHVLNARLGRLYTPFGEEYQTRYAIDNPLISHSLSDLWAVDAGLELYGREGTVSYALAVQNGGISDTRDFDGDKAVAGRVSWDPTSWLHVSASGMRTGDLDVKNDQLSAMWFGNGFFRSLGSSKTTKFHTVLAEGDIEWRLPHGHLRAFGGYIRYDDNDPTLNNQRDVYYYSIEGVHDVVGNLYAAVRFSQVFAPKGFPIVADGTFPDYFFNELTDQMWRLSLGAGYRYSRNVLLKAEYTLENGRTTDGEHRDHEDLFALEAAFRF